MSPFPTIPTVRCTRYADGPRQHNGPCASNVIIEWEQDAGGKVARTLLINGAAIDIEIRLASDVDPGLNGGGGDG
jgi:hypothetical protein